MSDNTFTIEDLWAHVEQEARRIMHRANNFDDHPSYDSPAAIKHCAIEVEGMWKMATSLNHYRLQPEHVRQAIRSMDVAVHALYTRRRKARETATPRRRPARPRSA